MTIMIIDFKRLILVFLVACAKTTFVVPVKMTDSEMANSIRGHCALGDEAMCEAVAQEIERGRQ